MASKTEGKAKHERIKFVSPSGHVMFCLFYRYWWNSYIKHNFFYSFSEQQNSAIKVVKLWKVWTQELSSGNLSQNACHKNAMKLWYKVIKEK